MTTNNHEQIESEEDTMSTESTEQNLSESTEQDASEGTEKDSENPNREAAKYRRQLRDVEAQRDTLTGQVEAMQKAMIENEVARAGYKPAAFWSRDENTADQFFTEDGSLDTDALADAITTTADELGLKGKARGPVAPKEGGTSRPRATKTWDSAFQA